MHALAVAREEAIASMRALKGLTGRNDIPRLANLRVRSGAQFRRQSGHRAWIGGRECRSHRERFGISDGCFRFAQAMASDQRNGFKPLAVVATVGTTSTASVDPIGEISALCREQKICLHIDAAYGGGLALLPEREWVSDGWEKADSLVINPHKMLFVPLDFSVLYVRDLERLRRVFSSGAGIFARRQRPARISITWITASS